jgi:hypothetical protein
MIQNLCIFAHAHFMPNSVNMYTMYKNTRLNHRRKFRSQTSDNTDEKQRWEESEKRREEDRRSNKRKSEKKEDSGTRKGSKVANHCVLPMVCDSGGSKSRLGKAVGTQPSQSKC